MAKANVTDAVGKGSVQKASRVSTSRKFLSQEKVVESNSEDEGESESESESGEDDNAMKTAKHASRPGIKSQDSSGDDETGRSDVSEESEESDESENDTPSTPKEAESPHKSKSDRVIDGAHNGEESVSGAGSTTSGEEVDSSSEEPSSSSEEEGTAPKPTLHISQKEQPRPKFIPPTGFQKVDAFEDRLPLDPAGLENKQLWHITIPTGVSVDELSTISMADLTTGGVIMSSGGIDYSISEEKVAASDPQDSNKTLLLPDGFDKKYKPQNVAVSRTFHVKPKVVLPNLSSLQANPTKGSAAASRTTQPTISKVKPQPKGLKMRYRPPAFGSGRIGVIGWEGSSEESSEDLEDAPPRRQSFKHPKPVASAALAKISASATNGHESPAEGNSAKKRKRAEKQIEPKEIGGTPVKKQKSKEKTPSKSSKSVTPAPAAPTSTALINGNTPNSDDDGDEESDEEPAKAVKSPSPAKESGIKEKSKEEKEAKRQRKLERELKRKRKEERAKKKEAKKKKAAV